MFHQIATQVTSLSENSPLYDCAGALGNQDTSYSAIHQRLNAKVQGYADKYTQFVVDYVIEWDKVITARVTTGLKTTEQHRRDLDHYQRKVEEMRGAANKILAKGKQVDDKTQEKLKRNEEKLIKAKELYNTTARDMCMVMEEATDRSWKDLHPILVKMAQFDMTLANDEAKALQELESVVTALKGLASTHDLKAAGRLKELQTQEPSLLYTGSNSGSVAALTNGDVASSVGGYSATSFGESTTNSLPPGSVAPQGMGGYPMQIQEEPTMHRTASATSVDPSMHRAASMTSIVSAPSSGNASWHNSAQGLSTLDMLTVANSAAPPPTMDQVNAANHNSMNGSASFNYGAPAPAPPAYAPPPPPFSPPPPPPATPPGSLHGNAPWSAPQPMAPSYGAPSSYGAAPNPFGPPPTAPSTNPFGDAPTGRPQTNTNPFAY